MQRVERLSAMVGDRDEINRALFLIVMGVSGTGKSTLGAALSNALKVPFIDGDDLHPPSNVAKMSRGEALTDEDRKPWLARIRQTAVKSILDQLGVPASTDIEPCIDKPETRESMDKFEEEGMPVEEECRGTISPLLSEVQHRPGIIIACSALKKTYRDILRGSTRLSPSPCCEDSSDLNAVAIQTRFVFLRGSRDMLMDRMQKRKGHFMKVQMLESQLDTLESPEDGPDVITVPIERSTEEQVRRVVRAIDL
ncbi:P-loop containing nucleoside triphosphate hydrolase protein [Pisolithus croceorrhizus]|nr:P-loop containing nucleoside triphosphate hydrolase protein [Pisolithus croceorrhizus]